MRKAAAVHAHPFSMLTFLYRFLFLLIIPLARGFLSALTGDLLSWISGAWMDILTVLLIFLLAWKKWDCFKYYMDERGIFYTSGIFFKHETFIPVDRICTCAVMRPFWLRPLKVARLRVDTIARGANKADVSFYCLLYTSPFPLYSVLQIGDSCQKPRLAAGKRELRKQKSNARRTLLFVELA